MKSIFDKEVRNELISRINSLSENSHAQWGKMNAYQMLKHCSLAEEMYLGKRTYKRVFLGYIFGKTALKEMTKDETPLARNARTSPIFIVTDNGDLNEQKE